MSRAGEGDAFLPSIGNEGYLESGGHISTLISTHEDVSGIEGGIFDRLHSFKEEFDEALGHRYQRHMPYVLGCMS